MSDELRLDEIRARRARAVQDASTYPFGFPLSFLALLNQDVPALCAEVERARAALSTLEEWREADEAMRKLEQSLGVSVILNERIDAEQPRELARLKAVEFSKRLALRDAADSLRRARADEESEG
jgi:uncharacterized small protein (DUF1192 family)